MKIAILGYGKEGKSVEQYFKTHDYEGEKVEEIKVFDNFKDEDVAGFGLEKYDAVFRSPSVRPQIDRQTASKAGGWDSSTKYFFRHCPAPIIGVTGTKGKGTTCTLTKSLLEALGKKVHLVGNIGLPCLDELDKIDKDDVVVYEISSFQLWDIEQSPKYAAILRLEPDHLDVHKDFQEYLDAKANIAKHQSEDDWLVYYEPNENTRMEAEKSKAHKLKYPIEQTGVLAEILQALKVVGEHNKENAEAALLLVYAYKTHGEVGFEKFLQDNSEALKRGLANFKSLPHRIEFVRELNGVEYYDDSYSTTLPSVDVALKAFAGRPIILIAGGKDKGTDYGPMSERIFSDPSLEKAILMGETKKKFAEKAISEDQYKFAETFIEAIENAQYFAEAIARQNERVDEQAFWDKQKTEDAESGDSEKAKNRESMRPVVVLSSGTSSFDMFNSYGERGDLFKKYVNELK